MARDLAPQEQTMDDQVMGVAKQGLGRVQDAVGGLTGDAALQGKGKINEAVGATQHAFGDAKNSVFDEIVGGVRGELHAQLDTVEGYVAKRPLQALGVAAGVGLLLGLLLRGRSHTVYTRAPR